MYIELRTGEVITRSKLHEKFPRVGFPAAISDEVLMDFGYANVQTPLLPEPVPGKSIVLGPVEATERGYHYTWVFQDLVAGREDVDAERDRRIDSGIEFYSVKYQSRATDRENIAGAAQLAFMAVVGGTQEGDLRWSDPDNDFVWIAADNSLVAMDAPTVVEFGKSAAERKQQLIFAARQLKDMSPVPQDYTDDKWWP